MFAWIISFAEKSNLIFFAILVLLWFFRDPGFMPGYGKLFPKKYVHYNITPVLKLFNEKN